MAAELCPSTHSLTDKLLQGSVQLVPHVIDVLLYVVLCIVPLFFQLVLHYHLTLGRENKTKHQGAALSCCSKFKLN